jgi:hypothetical protein
LRNSGALDRRYWITASRTIASTNSFITSSRSVFASSFSAAFGCAGAVPAFPLTASSAPLASPPLRSALTVKKIASIECSVAFDTPQSRTNRLNCV